MEPYPLVSFLRAKKKNELCNGAVISCRYSTPHTPHKNGSFGIPIPSGKAGVLGSIYFRYLHCLGVLAGGESGERLIAAGCRLRSSRGPSIPVQCRLPAIVPVKLDARWE